MNRPGSLVTLWMIVTLFATEFYHAPTWSVIVASLVIGWYYNYRDDQRHA